MRISWNRGQERFVGINMRTVGSLSLIALPLIALPIACNGILGIEERTLDATAGLSCETYCETTQQNCTGDFAIYASLETCMLTCAQLPLGTADNETSGNTIACRLRNANLASETGEFDTHCPAAGPGGDATCGDDCEGYCDLMAAFCPSEFSDEEECLEVCAGVPTDGYYAVPGLNEDHIQCRLWHLTSATLDDSHCDHANGAVKCELDYDPDGGTGGDGGGGDGGSGGA